MNLADYFPRVAATPLNLLMKVMNAIIVASGTIMALTFFMVVVLRYGFGADLFAYEEWLMTIAFWMFFIASAAATHDRAHVNADIVGFLITDPKLIWYRSLLVETLELIVVITLAYWGYLMCMEELATYPKWQSTIALKIPFLVPRVGIFIGFLLMALYNALHLYLLIKNGPADAKPSQDTGQETEE